MAHKKRIRNLFTLASASGIVVAIFLYFFIYAPNMVVKNISPMQEIDSILIFKGYTKHDVLKQLQSKALIKDTSSLSWLMTKKNYKGANIVEGLYLIKAPMTNNDFVNFLRAGRGRSEVKIIINSCLYKSDLAVMLTNNLALDSLEVLDWLENEQNYESWGYNNNTIMSMFLADTYFVNYLITRDELMRRMRAEHDKFWDDERRVQLEKLGLTDLEVYILASIVDAETNYSSDMPDIAGVYYNRLQINMPLQADPTLKYALGDQSIRRVLDKDKLVDSPYNTYKNTGLPPGPIMMPSKKALEAALYPSNHDFYYFVASSDLSGRSEFSKTYNEHLKKARRYQQALNTQSVYR